MKWFFFLISVLATQPAWAQLKVQVEATFKGKPIPQSKIKLVAFDQKEVRSKNRVSPSKDETAIKRSNPTQNSANWCGSVNHATSGNQIKVVYAMYQHPGCTKRPGVVIYPQAAAAWIGIDGDTHTSSLLQSGTVCKIDNSTGIVRNEAWFQWFPSAAYTIASLPVAAGDWFEVTINTSSTTAATVTISNISQGYSYYISLSGGQALGRLDADWVVERPAYGAGLAGFAQHDDTWFVDAYATRVTGSLGILGATQYQILNACSSAEYSNTEMVAWSV